MAKRAVRNRDTGETYPSISMAAQLMSVSRPSLLNSIRKGHLCRGYRWEYVERLPDDPIPPPPKRHRPVEASDGRRWADIKAAARELGYAQGSIYWAIYHRRPIGGLNWRYAA